MTSEGPHHPGQEPDEVSPGAGGPAPYGDRPAQQHTGYGVATPDLGWAPPPPAQPGPPAPAWPASHEQPQHARGTAQPPQQGEPGAWNPPGDAQPGWHAQGEQPGQQPWAAGGSPEQPGWPQGEQSAPAWAQPGPAARGAAQVPAPDAWPAHDGGTAGQESAQSGGWHTDPARQDDRPQQPDWAAAPQQDDPARSGGWAGTHQDEQPAWAQPEPAARGAAQVPPAAPAWAGQDEPAPSAGWNAEPRPEQSGGWATGQQDDHPRQPDWAAAPQQDDPARSGGWAGTQQDEQPRQADWGAPDDRSPAGWEAPAEQRPGGAWDGPADDPAPDEPGGWGATTAPPPADRPEQHGWTPAESTSTPPARATASVPGDGGPQAWSPDAGQPPQWNGADRPAGPDVDLPSRTPSIPNVEPWDAAEAWGRAGAEPARGGNDRETDRPEQPPVYQPAPGPGISPANAVPLPPQEQRVPGASLAAAPPADYSPPAQFAPEQPAYAEQSARDGGAPAYERDQPGWGPAGSRHEEPQSPAGPVVPTPRTSPEAAEPAAGAVSASASVPLASRVMPPTDQALRPTGTPTPQPRVYGRPARPEQSDEPEPVEQDASRPEHAPPPRFDQAPEPRFDDRSPVGPNGFDDRRAAGPNGFAGAAPVTPASPAPPPAFPPGMPSFVDAPANNRPVNGVRPHPGADRPADHFGGPADHFGAPAGGGAAVGGAAVGAPPGYGPVPTSGAAPGGGFPPSFPPPPQQPAGPSWDQAPAEQNRFDTFKPEAEPKTEAPTPKVRNGRVLAAVLVAAVLILAVPLGLLTLLGKVGGDEPAPAYEVGTCVKQAGTGAAEVDCGEAGAFTIVSKVDAKEKCDPAQPHVVLAGDGPNRVLCLKPAGQ
ncbi:LppU/SCO3897 family protein [Micromonospora sp. LZ34]